MCGSPFLDRHFKKEKCLSVPATSRRQLLGRPYRLNLQFPSTSNPKPWQLITTFLLFKGLRRRQIPRQDLLSADQPSDSLHNRPNLSRRFLLCNTHDINNRSL